MFILSVPKFNWAFSKSGLLNQYAAGIVASLTFGMCSAAYVWMNPVRRELEQGEAGLTVYQLGWVASLPELAGLASPVPAGYLADLMGRRALLLACCPLQVVSWIALFFVNTYYYLYAVRVFQGLLLGAVFTVLPLYLAEIADGNTRGRLGVLSCLGWNLGILFEYALGSFLSYDSIIIANIAFPVFCFVLLYGFHETPYLLMMKNKSNEAEASLRSFRGPDANLSEEMAAINHAVLQDAAEEAPWASLFLHSKGMKALLIVLVMNVTINFSGGMSILEFSTETFRMITDDVYMSNMCTLAMGAALFVVPFLSILSIDRWGRRPILFISYLGSTLCLLPVALYFWANEGQPPNDWVLAPVLGIILYPAMINFGAMIIAHIYQAELFPSSTRSIASAVGAVAGSLSAVITVFAYPPMEARALNYLTFTLYTVFAALGLVASYLWAPETKGKRLDQINSKPAPKNIDLEKF